MIRLRQLPTVARTRANHAQVRTYSEPIIAAADVAAAFSIQPCAPVDCCDSCCDPDISGYESRQLVPDRIILVRDLHRAHSVGYLRGLWQKRRPSVFDRSAKSVGRFDRVTLPRSVWDFFRNDLANRDGRHLRRDRSHHEAMDLARS